MQQSQVTERWLPVVGWSGWYEVSCKGRVRSVDRIIRRKDGRTARQPGKMLALTRRPDGYLKVTLCRANGEQHQYRVHRLVLEAFVGPCPPGQECRHGPGGPADNRWPENIRWGTRADNNGEDKRRDGTDNRGERHPLAVLTEETVREIRRRYAAGQTAPQLAQEFGLGGSSILAAVTGVNWQHIAGALEPRKGTVRGERHGIAKLTEADVIAARTRFRQGEAIALLAREFSVSPSAMRHAINGKTWRHVI